MAAITDPSAVLFANTKIRPMADAMAQSYFTAKSLVAEWNATSMSTKILNTVDNIVDGSAQDGRHPMTGAQATAIITRAQEIITDYEATSSAKLNTVMVPAVNTQSKF